MVRPSRHTVATTSALDWAAMSTLLEIRASLVQVSRRYSRVAHEVEDLAHDVIVSALRRGSALDGELFTRSVRSAARQHGAFLARSAQRRRARETAAVRCEVTDVEASQSGHGAALSELSPGLRTTLLLLLLGLEKAELRWALGLTDAALRKRFQALREHAPLARPELPVRDRTAAHSRLRRSQVGLLPRLADTRAAGAPPRRVLGASDPDGFGVIFSEVLTAERVAATPDAPAAHARTLRRETPC